MTPEAIERWAVWATGLFVVSSLAGAVGPTPVVVAAVAVDLALFAAGCIAFVLTLVRAAARSRTDELTVSGLWFLSDSAPAPARRMLLGALAVQVVVALTTPFAERALAFGVLVPTFGLGCTGLWGAVAGTFPRRVEPPRRR